MIIPLDIQGGIIYNRYIHIKEIKIMDLEVRIVVPTSEIHKYRPDGSYTAQLKELGIELIGVLSCQYAKGVSPYRLNDTEYFVYMTGTDDALEKFLSSDGLKIIC